MQNNSKTNTVLLVILIILVSIGLFFLINDKEENDNNDISTPTGQTQTNNNPNGPDYIPYANSSTEDFYLDEANTALTHWLSDKKDLEDFKINKITFTAAKKYAQEPEKSWFSASDSDDAFLVSVSFSVKPTEAQRQMWAGPADPKDIHPDGWIDVNLGFVYIDKNTNGGYYIKSAGTGP